MHPVPMDQSRECLSCPLTQERAGPGPPEGVCILGAGPAPEPSLQSPVSPRATQRRLLSLLGSPPQPA